MAPNEQEYRKLYDILSLKWSKAFVEFYNQQLHSEVTSYAGRWILEPLGVFNGYSGVTTNQSEGFNTLLKTLTERKEYTIDSLVLALYFLQCYYWNEIQRGLAGLGQYSLLEQHKLLSIPVPDMDLFHCYAPEDIATKLKEQRSQNSVEGVDQVHQAEDQILEEDTNDGHEEPPQGQEQNTTPANITPASQIARAQLVLKNNHCIYQAELKTFVVQGTSGAHAVKLFPKANCTCPAKKECYHILAAKLYMGIDTKSATRRITMTQLRRNVRPRSTKRKGRKGPLQDDEIEPAPDAAVNSKQDKTTPEDGEYITHHTHHIYTTCIYTL